jgi:serine protease AprX
MEVALNMLASPLRRSRIRWQSRWAVAATVLASVAAGVSSAPAQARARWDVVTPTLMGAAQQHPSSRASVIVQFVHGVTEASAVKLVHAAGGRNIVALPIIRGVAAVMPLRAVALLGHSTQVHAITLNTRVKGQYYSSNPLANLATTFPWSTGAPTSWYYNATGAGVGVAVIDSGVDGNLPDFNTYSGYGGTGNPGAPPTSRVVETAVANPGASDATDPIGHGTMVAGIIAGNSLNQPANDPSYGKYLGEAPNANLISIKVGDDQGNSNELAVIMGIQFAVQHQADDNIRVINLSLESSVPQSYLTDPLDAAVESAWQHGITVVAAAGNLGNTPGAENYAPANDPYAITVGALDEQGQTNLSNDTVAPYSSVGVTQDGVSKPDLYAPGSHMTSVLAPHSAFAGLCPQCIQGGEYFKASGTSFAAPVVSGAVADLLSKNPNLTPNQVKGTLLSSAQGLNSTVGPIKALRLGSAITAYQHPTANQGLTPSTLLDQNSNLAGWPTTPYVQAAGSLAADYARSSWSQSSWSQSSWSQSSWSQSSWSQSSWSQSSWSQSSWSQSSWSVAGPN